MEAFGQRPGAPRPPARNEASVIEGRRYTDHAFDQMQNRGIPPSAVENTIKNGTASGSNQISGRTLYYDKDNNITVVLERGSKDVVSVYYGER